MHSRSASTGGVPAGGAPIETALEPRARAPLSEFEVRDLLDQLPAILYVADVGAEGHWHYVSSGVEAILGFSPEEWLADPGMWERPLDPEDRDRGVGRE